MDGSSWQSQSLMLVLRYEHERFVSLLREIDDDDTGLSKRDFRAAVTSLGSKIGLNPPREVIDAAFSAFDARSAGLLSLSDVSASLTRPLNASPVAGIPQRVANAFNFFFKRPNRQRVVQRSARADTPACGSSDVATDLSGGSEWHR